MFSRRKEFAFPVRVSGHAYRKLVRIDLTVAEFELLLADAEVIEEAGRSRRYATSAYCLSNGFARYT